MKISKPVGGEINTFYARYVDLVKEPDLLTALPENQQALISLFKDIPAEIEVFRYDTNKWSIKEVLLHIIDFERYFGFKAFVTLRNDRETVLNHPGRDHYLFNAHAETRSLADLIPEFISVRSATISLFRQAGLPSSASTGNHLQENHAVSARAIGFAIVGHSMHHMNTINERYLRQSKMRDNS